MIKQTEKNFMFNLGLMKKYENLINQKQKKEIFESIFNICSLLLFQ